jgi:hypothetical protein
MPVVRKRLLRTAVQMIKLTATRDITPGALGGFSGYGMLALASRHQAIISHPAADVRFSTPVLSGRNRNGR